MAWRRIASFDALQEGGVIAVEVEGKTIALYRLGDEVRATDGICTHAFAHLADGFVDDDKIECPLHQGLFDIRTGKALAGPVVEDLKVYPVKVEGDDVFINLEGTGTAEAATVAASD